MPLAEASTLAEHHSHQPDAPARAFLLPHDPAADLAALARLAEHCERFSPLVGWKTTSSKFQVASCKLGKSEVGGQKPLTWNLEHETWNCLFLDITGIGILFGGEELLAREAITTLTSLGYEARVAIADTIAAAWALAVEVVEGSGFRVQSSEEEAGCISEAQCTDSDDDVLSTQYSVLSTQYSSFTEHQPDSRPPLVSPSPRLLLSLSPIRNPQSAIRNLPLAALRLPQETLDLFTQLGIVRLDQLLALPRSSLASRFGELVPLRLDQLFGHAQETIVPHRPPPEFAAERVLDYPLESREHIEQLIRDLIDQLAQDLAPRRYGVLRLSCRLDCAPGRPTTLQIGLFRPSAHPQHLWDLMRMQLEQAKLPGPVGRVTLAAFLTAPLENRQGELFAGNRQEASRQFELLIDRLSSRLGQKAVLRPELTVEPLPERAVRYVPLIESRVHKRSAMHRRARSEVRGQIRMTATAATPHSAFRIPHSSPPLPLSPSPPLPAPLLRPLALHSSPLPLEVMSVVPDGPPVSFRLRGRTCHVARSWDQERIETGWWRGKSIRRDYYRIETDSGHRYWLFRQLSDGKWYLHGEFA
jgi:protein ImuB